MESSLSEKEKLLMEEKAKFQKLKEDFKYNLKLLAERDAELDKYDSSHAAMKKQLGMHDAKMSELHIQLDDMKGALKREELTSKEHQDHYQQRLRERQAELDHYRSSKDNDLQRERENMEGIKRNLERQLHEVEEELQLQKQELSVGYEDAIRKREHEWRTKMDEMNITVLSHELKVKLLTKELEQARLSEEKGHRQVEQVEGDQQQLQKKIQQLEWKAQDITAIKNSKIKELEETIKQLKLKMQRDEEYFQRKNAELDRHAKDQAAAVDRQKEAKKQREADLQAEINSLKDKLQQLEIKLRQEEWKNQDATKRHQDQTERLESQLKDIQSQWESYLSNTSKATVTKDVELQRLKEDEERIKIDLMQRKEDIDRYKNELTAAVNREEELEQSKAQLDLDWQRRYEGAEREQYQKVEDLIRNLTVNRDQALATNREKEKELLHNKELINMLTKERDQALLTLKQHGLIVNRTIELTDKDSDSTSATDDMEDLRKQNDNLRKVIHQMRQQMETLGSQVPDGNVKIKHSATDEYIRNLEAELKHQKAKYRLLQQQEAHTADRLQEGRGEHTVTEAMRDNPTVQRHIEQLNNTIGDLRKEKVELAAQLKKQQARIQHLEVAMDTIMKEPREKQVKLEQLQYDLGAAERHHLVEVSGLKKLSSELQVQLEETRREASEYHKASLEANAQLTDVQHQISALKMEIAQGRPPVNYGAQELLIQQLQGEIQRLQQKQKGENTVIEDIENSTAGGQQIINGGKYNSSMLMSKLQLAVKQIKQLALEKQQLIEVGNRLRAELNKNDIRPPSPPRQSTTQSTMSDSAHLQQRIQNKLQQLEQLQYDMTKQELAKGSKSYPKHRVTPAAQWTSSIESETPEEDRNPRSILKKPSQSDTDIVQEPSQTSPEMYSSKEISGFRPQSSQSVRDSQATLLMSMSSMGGESLQDIWKMLDDSGVTPRPETPTDKLYSGHLLGMVPDPRHNPSPDPITNWALQGNRAKMEPRSHSATSINPENKRVSSIAVKTKKPKAQIRNFNQKEDRK